MQVSAVEADSKIYGITYWNGSVSAPSQLGSRTARSLGTGVNDADNLALDSTGKVWKRNIDATKWSKAFNGDACISGKLALLGANGTIVDTDGNAYMFNATSSCTDLQQLSAPFQFRKVTRSIGFNGITEYAAISTDGNAYTASVSNSSALPQTWTQTGQNTQWQDIAIHAKTYSTATNIAGITTDGQLRLVTDGKQLAAGKFAGISASEMDASQWIAVDTDGGLWTGSNTGITQATWLTTSVRLAVGARQFKTDTINGSTTMDCIMFLEGTPQQSETSTFTLTFDLNGAPGTDPTPQQLANGAATTSPTDPAWDGHRFTGWYTDPTGGQQYQFGQPLTADTILYAHWQFESVIACAPQTGDPAASIWQRTSIIGAMLCIVLSVEALRMQRMSSRRM